jgi:hypothetical protein
MPRLSSLAPWVACMSAGVLCATLVARGEITATARVVREEALRPNRGPEGRPLPLLAHWHRMTMLRHGRSI